MRNSANDKGPFDHEMRTTIAHVAYVIKTFDENH